MIKIRKPYIWLLLTATIVCVLGLKEIRPYFFTVSPPLDLDGQPALLFFNNEEGCECIRPLYTKADEIISDWPSDNRSQIPVYRIILDQRPDLQRQYDIERAPMLLLLDANGQVVWRERGVASNPKIFDLTRVEAKAQFIVYGTDND